MPVAVVTGSSSGIGRQTALEFARQGYAVVLHARSNLAGLQSTAKSLRQIASRPAEVLCLTADISSPAACNDLATAAFAWRGTVDAWVNNAGADVLTTSARELSFEGRLQQLLRVDVAGTIRLSRLAADRMRTQHASSANRRPTIINIGWDQAPLGMEGEPGELFCTSKGAVMAFSTALAMSVAPDVRVNCVAPGWIKTAWGAQSASDYWEQRAQREALLDRWGTPEDVAQTIVWLASEQAQFVNAQIVSVNGGRRFYPYRGGPMA